MGSAWLRRCRPLHGAPLCGADAVQILPDQPHWVFPGMQFLPLNARSWLAPRWPLGHTHGWAERDAREEVLYTELLTLTEMRCLFPDAHVAWERFAGLPKSLTAFR